MNSKSSISQESAALDEAFRIHSLQRNAYLKNQNSTAKERKENLLKLERLLLDNKDEIAEAVCRDYGNRSLHETKLLEIFGTVDGIRYARKNLRKWMKPQKRHTSIWFAGAKNRVIPQPKGVVGIITPWNYPLFLCISPVTSAFAAGNRCIIKMAKESSNLSQLMHRLISETFSEETLAIIPDINGNDFTRVPYDHLVFTGSANTARHVMRAASKHLTPVTLELGGKSPVIVDKAYNHSLAAKRIMQFKTINGGQTCVAPDYIFVHKSKLDEFLQHCKQETQKRYHSVDDNNYTSIITHDAFSRLENYLTDAKERGAKVHNLLGDTSQSFNKEDKKMAPHAIINASDDCLVMQEEIFGPIMPIITYQSLDEVLDYINARPNPLGLYLFTSNSKMQAKVTDNTLSGAIAINDCSLQVGQHDMPFGGIGESGMGQYHAFEGFKEFSKLKPIFKQARFPGIELLYPPYGKRFNFVLNLMLKLKI